MQSFAVAFSIGLLLVACGDDSAPQGGSGSGGEAAGGAGGELATGGTSASGGGDAGGGPAIDKAAACDDMFGDALTASFGRLDGTVLAVVRPVDTQCPLVNDDHVVLEVTMNGATYRVVINIQSSFGDPDVRYLELDHALPGQSWSEGWHTGVSLDYVADFGVHAGPPFEAVPLAELADRVTDAITIGEHVSVFSESSGGASSHKVHRNQGSTDGAIVLHPDGPAPKALLFHFENQTF